MAIDWRGSSFMSLDPGINSTGYSLYRVDMVGKLGLREYGCFKPLCDAADEDNEYLKVASIADQAMVYARCKGPAFSFLERPPSTVYNQNQGSKNKTAAYLAVARAQSVFKTMGVFYALHTILRTQTKAILRPILPSQWELSKKQRDGLEVKEWSLLKANEFIQFFTPGAKELKEQNTADAITMGYFAYQRGYHDS